MSVFGPAHAHSVVFTAYLIHYFLKLKKNFLSRKEVANVLGTPLTLCSLILSLFKFILNFVSYPLKFLGPVTNYLFMIIRVSWLCFLLSPCLFITRAFIACSDVCLDQYCAPPYCNGLPIVQIENNYLRIIQIENNTEDAMSS